ncbi:Uncharacterised protein [Mycobacteroides abscessus subsp. abscessus]|nr:Uncharacterised protein [Mycobacteroides abscessus subsp. abscessus]
MVANGRVIPDAAARVYGRRDRGRCDHAGIPHELDRRTRVVAHRDRRRRNRRRRERTATNPARRDGYDLRRVRSEGRAQAQQGRRRQGVGELRNTRRDDRRRQRRERRHAVRGRRRERLRSERPQRHSHPHSRHRRRRGQAPVPSTRRRADPLHPSRRPVDRVRRRAVDEIHGMAVAAPGAGATDPDVVRVALLPRRGEESPHRQRDHGNACHAGCSRRGRVVALLDVLRDRHRIGGFAGCVGCHLERRLDLSRGRDRRHRARPCRPLFRGASTLPCGRRTAGIGRARRQGRLGPAARRHRDAHPRG